MQARVHARSSSLDIPASHGAQDHCTLLCETWLCEQSFCQASTHQTSAHADGPCAHELDPGSWPVSHSAGKTSSRTRPQGTCGAIRNRCTSCQLHEHHDGWGGLERTLLTSILQTMSDLCAYCGHMVWLLAAAPLLGSSVINGSTVPVLRHQHPITSHRGRTSIRSKLANQQLRCSAGASLSFEYLYAVCTVCAGVV